MAIPPQRVNKIIKEESEGDHRAVNGSASPSATQGDQRDNPEVSTVAVARTILSPALVTTFVLIFGGCCSNVYTLESILSLSPATGLLVTFLQFLFTSLFTLPSQVTTKRPLKSRSSISSSSLIPGLRSRSVPLYKWIAYTVLFLSVNILNNNAFKYRISIPLHIILRSAGPVTSMLVGYMFAGRRYELRKVIAVVLLFSGVVLAALSDASSKGKVAIAEAATSSMLSQQLPGFVLLFSALLISALMGIYTDNLYTEHGRSSAVANENLFYSHVLSLPYFAMQYKSLYGQYLIMLSSATSQASANSMFLHKGLNLPTVLRPLAKHLPIIGNFSPVPIILLLANAFTQIVCISGVHRLSTQTTSLTVSIVLNIRKLVSLLLSIWLFGNKLPLGVTIGAAIVFLGGGLYGLPSRSAQGMVKKEGRKASIQSKKDM